MILVRLAFGSLRNRRLTALLTTVAIALSIRKHQAISGSLDIANDA